MNKHIIVLITCHNRKNKTLECLDALYSCNLPPGASLSVVLADDGSSDGTSEAVMSRFPDVEILHGNGTLFWNRGMLKAWEYALTKGPDYVLWLNDDTALYLDAIQKIIKTHDKVVHVGGASGIVVGTTQSASGRLTYGGIDRASKLNPTKFKRVVASDQTMPCLTMNGNCVLVPRAVYEEIGLLEAKFQHGMGDFDYGLRATKANIPIWVAPGYVGICENDNDIEGSYKDKSLPLGVRLRKMLGPKGLPVRDWGLFCRRHAGFGWPLFWLWPYAKTTLTSVWWALTAGRTRQEASGGGGKS